MKHSLWNVLKRQKSLVATTSIDLSFQVEGTPV